MSAGHSARQVFDLPEPSPLVVIAIATRYDKRAINFLAGVYAAPITIWLN